MLVCLCFCRPLVVGFLSAATCQSSRFVIRWCFFRLPKWLPFFHVAWLFLACLGYICISLLRRRRLLDGTQDISVDQVRGWPHPRHSRKAPCSIQFLCFSYNLECFACEFVMSSVDDFVSYMSPRQLNLCRYEDEDKVGRIATAVQERYCNMLQRLSLDDIELLAFKLGQQQQQR